MTTNKSSEESRKAIQNPISVAASSSQDDKENLSDEPDIDITTGTDDDKFKDVEDSKVLAPITIAPDGGWGWVVVAASFWHVYCVEGIGFTFGPMKGFIMEDLQKNIAAIAVINSLTIGFMCLFGPVASAVINRFGFRITSMTGAVISSFGAFIASICGNYITLLIFYGAVMGVGFSLTMSASSLIVGFYFKKKRALATALCLCGNSIGISSNSIIIFYLNRRGWRTTMLLQSAIIGSMYFTSMVFRPLLSITVHKMSTPDLDKKRKIEESDDKSRRGSVISEYHRAADLVDRQDSKQSRDLLMESSKRRTSRIVSKIDLQTLSKTYSKSKLQAIRELEEQTDKLVITILNEEPKKKQGCCAKFFTWRPHVKEVRPLYRDDAFHAGKPKKSHGRGRKDLPTIEESPSGINYHLAVSRVTTAKDIKEKKGICSTAVKRVLITMADPRLLRLKSFFFFLFGVFFSYLGIVIPYVYVIDRSKAFNVPKKHYQWFVSVIALSGLFGRIIIGLIATKRPAAHCAQVSAWMVGISSLTSNFFKLYYLQYIYCVVFGFFMSGIVICRFLIIVDVYGLELLTNGAGLTMLTQGLAFLVTLPVAGMILSQYGVFFSFIYSAVCCFCGAICFLLVPIVRRSEVRTT